MDANLGWTDMMMVSSGGDKIGKIVDTHFDDTTMEPDWLAVSTGGKLGGAKKRYVPIAAVTRQGDVAVVPFDKDTVKNAPEVEAMGVLTEHEAVELFNYYGMPNQA